MNIKKFLICAFAALSLSGCGSISSGWDWFFDDKDSEVTEAEYEKEMAEEDLMADEALMEEELAAEEFAEEGEMEEEMEMEEEAEMMEEDDYGDSPSLISRPPESAIYFDYKSTKVSASALNILQAHAKYLRSHSNAVVALVGNTDSVASAEYNKRLGLKRAEAVAEVLVEMGVEPSQLHLKSKGKNDPATSSDSEKAAGLNRRVEIIYK